MPARLAASIARVPCEPMAPFSRMLGPSGGRRRPRRIARAPRRTTTSGGRRPCGPDRRTRHTLQFEELGLSADLLRTVAEEGYTEPTPVQERAIPLVLAGQGRPRRRPDRHRQDGRLHAARSSTGCARTRTPRSRPPATRSACLVLTPTRELAVQVAEAVKTYGRKVPLRSSVVYGGVPLDPQIKELLRRRRDPRRHAGPAAGPRRPARREPGPGGDPRPRRGGPDAGHGLHARHPPDPGPAAQPQADPAVLGHVLRRHQAPRGLDPQRPRDDRGRPPRHRRRDRPPARLPGRPRPQGGAARAPDRRGRLAPGARVHADEARGVAPRVVAGPARRRGDGDPLATARSRTARRPSRRSRRARSGSSWRPTSRPAAWTSTTCPTWSTSSCRGTPRTTSTASAGPAGRAPRATRSASSRSTRRTCCAASSACSRSRSRGRSRTGFTPRRDQEAQPLRAPRGAGGPRADAVARRLVRRVRGRRRPSGRTRPSGRWAHAALGPRPSVRPGSTRAASRARGARSYGAADGDADGLAPGAAAARS